MPLTDLKTPIQTDPLGLGFAPLLAAGNFNGIAVILNDPSSKGAGTITLPSMSNVDFVTALLPYYRNVVTSTSLSAALIQYYRDLWQTILSMPTVNFGDSRVSGVMSEMVSDGILTTEQATTINQRHGSYAEVLCGAGAGPTGSDISALFFPPTGG